MSSPRLATAELLRLTSAPMLRLALVALILIPCLHVGLYLYANRDPYAGMNRVPAAIVTEDRGATLSTGEHLRVGDQIVDELVATGSFDWHRVGRAEAVRGLEDEEYDFAIVVPAGFSADLASVATENPRQAHLEQLTNDTNAFLTRTISNQVISEITTSVAAKLSSTTASRVMTALTTIRAQVHQASDGAGQLASGSDQMVASQQRLVDGSVRLADGLGQAGAGTTELASGAHRLETGLAKLDAATVSLPAQTQALADSARQVAAGNAELARVGSEIAAGAQRLRGTRTTLGPTLSVQLDAIDAANAAAPTPDPRVSRAVASLRAGLSSADTDVDAVAARIAASADSVKQLSVGSMAVADGTARVAQESAQLRSGIAAAHEGSTQLSGGASTLASGLNQLGSGANQLRDGQAQAVAGAKGLSDGARRLAADLDDGVRQIPAMSEAQRTAAAQVMGAPIGLAKAAGPEARDYGGGLAPFFLALSLWIGAYGLFLLVRPLSLRAIAANQSGLRVALSGWLTPAFLAALQAVAVFLLTAKGLGVRVDHPWLTVAFMAGVSCVYAAILLALASRWGAIGKFAGLVLMVLQLVSAGGTFPWQTLPEPLQIVHHLAPMSYVVEGLRHLMYGRTLQGMAPILAVLGAYLVLALITTRWAALRLRVWTPGRIKPSLEL